MKKSIKVFTLSLLATGMLVGCGADPVPAPDWSAQQKQEMKEILYGEVLPYVSEVTGIGFRSSSSDGYVVVTGDEVSPEQLASYAGKFTVEAGWTLLGKYTVEGKDLSYTYEKELTTQEGARHVQVQFGGIDKDYKFIENGSFMLFATDPYFYSYEDIKVDVDLFTSEFDGGEFALPAITGADRYDTYEGDPEDPEEGHFLLIYCYSSDATLVEKYYDVLSKSKDNWKVYPAQEDPDDGTVFYMADSPDGKYGIQYFYDADHACMIVYISDANYLYSFPQAEMNAIIASKESESTLPAGFAGDRFDYREQYGATIIFFDKAPEGDAGYGALLEEAGWTVHGFVEPVQQYVATSADEKVSVRYWFDHEDPTVMYFMVTDPAFVAKMPEDVKNYISNYFYSQSVIPGVEGASKYIFNNQDGLLGIYYESEAEDGGYSALLAAAGFTVSEYSFELENGSSIHFAYSPDSAYYVSYNFYNGVLSVYLDDVLNMTYYTSEWPASELAELNFVMGSYNFEIPALTVASEDAYFETFIYATYIEIMGYKIPKPVGTAIYVENATQQELEAYIGSFTGAGWTVSEGSTLQSGMASKEDSNTKEGLVEVEWIAQQDAEDLSWYFQIVAYYVDEKPEGAVYEYPVEAIEAYFNELDVDITDVSFSSYTTASEDAYFVGKVDEEGEYRIEVYGSSVEEQAAFVEALEKDGWVKVSEPSEKYPYDFILAYGETGIYVDVQDYTDYGGYIRIIFYYEEPAKHVDEFPLAELNAFLTENELGFTLESALPTAEGEGYFYKIGEDSGYPFFEITLVGDQFDAVLEALQPGITAGAYEVYRQGEGYVIYTNEDVHEIDVVVDEDGNTVVTFWY